MLVRCLERSTEFSVVVEDASFGCFTNRAVIAAMYSEMGSVQIWVFYLTT